VNTLHKGDDDDDDDDIVIIMYNPQTQTRSSLYM
jgi:hypothetical protein